MKNIENNMVRNLSGDEHFATGNNRFTCEVCGSGCPELFECACGHQSCSNCITKKDGETYCTICAPKGAAEEKD